MYTTEAQAQPVLFSTQPTVCNIIGGHTLLGQPIILLKQSAGLDCTLYIY